MRRKLERERSSTYPQVMIVIISVVEKGGCDWRKIPTTTNRLRAGFVDRASALNINFADLVAISTHNCALSEVRYVSPRRPALRRSAPRSDLPGTGFRARVSSDFASIPTGFVRGR